MRARFHGPTGFGKGKCAARFSGRRAKFILRQSRDDDVQAQSDAPVQVSPPSDKRIYVDLNERPIYVRRMEH
ncbi:MAG: hypothetical protein K2X76_03620 [Sphingomonas sp.]|nr:hypothetical protein [Sphingomonas sp.]